MSCRIELHPIELQLLIGCEPEERRNPQPVTLSALVASLERFPAAKTDSVSDTVDAGRLRSLLIETAGAARVHTLERLGSVLEEVFRREFHNSRGLSWEIRISKPRFGWSYVQSWSA